MQQENLDDDVIATALEISEGDIMEELRDYQEYDEEEENDDDISIEEIFDPVVEKPSRPAIESALNIMLPCLVTKACK